MAQQVHNTHPDFASIAILLLLSYVLSSAPRFVRNLQREAPVPAAVQQQSTRNGWIEIGKAYTIDPYLRAWNRLSAESLLMSTSTGFTEAAAILH